MARSEMKGLGHFGDAASTTLFRRRPFGDGTFRRWWSQMFYRVEKCVFRKTSMVRLQSMYAW